jgi:hypothetical protein
LKKIMMSSAFWIYSPSPLPQSCTQVWDLVVLREWTCQLLAFPLHPKLNRDAHHRQVSLTTALTFYMWSCTFILTMNHVLPYLAQMALGATQ